jgi:branched-chain amino acid transport system substrate-binding protein
MVMTGRFLRYTLLAAAAAVLVTFAAHSSNPVRADGTPAATMAPTMAGTPVQLSGDPVVIGVALAQSGTSALLGQDEAVGAQLAQDYFNSTGGINGRPIKLVVQDTTSDATTAVNVFNTLISQNVVAIVGPTLSTEAFAADPVADKAGVPVIAPSNTAAGIPQIGHYVIRVSAPIALVAPNAVKAALAINPNIKNVAVYYAQDDAFSKSETGTFQATVKSLNLNLTTVQTGSTKDTDFTTQITAIMGTNPDLVIVSGLSTDAPNLVKQLREVGYTGLVIGGNGLNTPKIFPVCQAQCDGMIIAQAYSYQATTDINKTFVQIYMSKQNANPGQFPAQAFSSVQVVVEGLRALDKKSPLSGMKLEDLRKALRDQIVGGTYQTPLGEISFTEVKNDKGDAAGGEVNQKQFYVAQIKMNSDGKTGQFVFIQ